MLSAATQLGVQSGYELCSDWYQDSMVYVCPASTGPLAVEYTRCRPDVFGLTQPVGVVVPRNRAMAVQIWF